MKDDLPDGWVLLPLDQLTLSVRDGTHTPPKRIAKGIPLLSARNIQNGTIDFSETYSFISPTDYHSINRTNPVERGDVLLTVVGSIGRSCVNTNATPFTVQRSVAIIRPNTNLVAGDYLSLMFRSPEFQSVLQDASSGTAQQGVYLGALKEFEIPVPPLPEQRRIVEHLEAVLSRQQRCQGRLEKIPAILKRFRQSILAAACSGRLTSDWRVENDDSASSQELRHTILQARKDLWEKRQKNRQRAARYPEPFDPDSSAIDFDIPDAWCLTTVSELAMLDVGFAFKSAEFSNSGVRLLRGENLEPGQLRWTDTKYWPKRALSGFEQLLIDEGEIVLALDRPLVSSGLKIARATGTDLPCLLVQRMMRFKLPDQALTDWLYYNLQVPRFITHLSDGLTGTDLPHVTGTGVGEFTLPLPPLREQEEIKRRVDALFTLAERIESNFEKARTRMQRLPQSILAMAFRGELVCTEAELAQAEGRDFESVQEIVDRLRVKANRGNGNGNKRHRTRALRQQTP
jgi:type I restriction enzyme S subunit